MKEQLTILAARSRPSGSFSAKTIVPSSDPGKGKRKILRHVIPAPELSDAGGTEKERPQWSMRPQPRQCLRIPVGSGVGIPSHLLFALNIKGCMR